MPPTIPPGDVQPPSINADELTTLRTFLDYMREAVIRKAEGLSDEAAHRPGVTSGTNLAWLLAHLTAVEHNWFVWSYAGEGGDDDLHDDETQPTASVTELIAAYRAAVKDSNAVIDAYPDLDRPGNRNLRDHQPPSMRWVIMHMIEETARHAGHADILRELADDTVGR